DGSSWRWQRDVRGRIVEHTTERPGSAVLRTKLRYEGERLVQIEHPHEQERLSYDKLGRLSQRILSRGPQGKQRFSATEHYTYDGADRLISWQLPEGGSLNYEWGVGRQLKAVRHDNGHAAAVLGHSVAGWLGLGQRTIIEPLAGARSGLDPKAIRTAAAAGEQDAAGLPAVFQSEQGYRWGNGMALRWHLNAQGQLAQMRWEHPGAS